MVSTVTTTTIAEASIGAAAVIGLITLLVIRELAAATAGSTLKLFTRHLTVAVIPLLIVFAFIVIIEVLELIS